MRIAPLNPGLSRTLLEVANSLTEPDITLGLLTAKVVHVTCEDAELDEALEAIVSDRRNGLGPRAEEVRLAVRDMLRVGAYRPTGRGKPASEYLLRSAASGEHGFPRINYVVDVCNYVSLKYLVPISLWDLDRAGTELYRFRRGLPAEEYVFNASGQAIRLEDLAVGCCRSDAEDRLGVPIVSPIKDCQATKTDERSRRIMASVYVPTSVVSTATLKSICSEFARFIGRVSSSPSVSTEVCPPGEIRGLEG